MDSAQVDDVVSGMPDGTALVSSQTPPMVRLRLDLAYDGTAYAGWAAQPRLRTIEGTLAEGLARILRVDAVRLTTAGRTDAGVHALGAVCHVDVPAPAYAQLPGRSDRDPGAAAVARLAGVLPADIVVRRVSVAPAGFDARFSAIWRRYRYRLLDRRNLLDPLRRGDTALWPHALDLAALNEASVRLVGLHDFAAFCRRREGATTMRTLLVYTWERDPDGVLIATVRADAFCHSMVRSLVGAVVPVGEGRRDPGWVEVLRSARERSSEVRVMPAHGLCLIEVAYPPDDQLAARAVESRSLRA